MRARLNLAQITPRVQLVVILEPPLANVIAIVHVRNHDISDARISLCLGLSHCWPDSAHDQYHTRRPGHIPLSVYLHHVLDVHLFGNAFLEKNCRMLGHREEGGVVVEGERRNDNAYANLEAVLHLELWVHACGEVGEELANGRSHTLLLDADRRIAEARCELERVNSVAVHDAVEID